MDQAYGWSVLVTILLDVGAANDWRHKSEYKGSIRDMEEQPKMDSEAEVLRGRPRQWSPT